MLSFLKIATVLIAVAPAPAVRAISVPQPPDPTSAVVVAVNPGMELIAIMAWLGERYPLPPDSPYKTDVWNHFKQFRTHPALATLRDTRLFPDFTEMGLFLEGFPTLRAVPPDSCTWYSIMGRERVVKILNDAVRFARDARYVEFRKAHAQQYARWSAALSAALQRDSTVLRVARFYNGEHAAAPPGSVRLFLEPLNGWGAHMIDYGRITGTNDGIVRFQMGPSNEYPMPDAALKFALDESGRRTVWHELAHAFARPLIAAHGAKIDSLARLFNGDDPELKRQNVTTWRYAFEENLVRAVVAMLVGNSRGPDAMNNEAKQQAGRGFVWVPLLTNLLATEYTTQRATYPSLERFGDRLLEILAEQKSAGRGPSREILPTGLAQVFIWIGFRFE